MIGSTINTAICRQQRHRHTQQTAMHGSGLHLLPLAALLASAAAAFSYRGVLQKELNHQQVKTGTAVGGQSGISFTEYHRYDEIRRYLSDLASNYPSLVTVQSIGQTYEGRPIDMIQVSSGNGANSSAPVILVDAGIHAREWIAPAAALYVIQQLVENATQSALADSIDWHVIPVLNPDGYEYTFTTERLWRKTRSPTSGECVGVDANRNFDFHWMEVGASDDPCSTTYAGAEVFSEPETRALRDYILANADRIKLYLTFHSYGPDALGRLANAAQVAAGAPNYTVGTFAGAMYAAAGTSADWAKAVGGVALSYTLELPEGGDAGFDPPASDIVGIVTPFFEAVRAFGQYVADNFGRSRLSA
ncbi:carboxypeptidase B-like isoform X2 [Schistocerca gregaria]|uniref:carboxypeptidase B-like isoform X2 n=1 Tax=Schistocerca gregaria TaxID=7010 RepID=UPI00211F0140|nr:carboxypeptidase B-like isoform X2 [Schistocerca gregaria]